MKHSTAKSHPSLCPYCMRREVDTRDHIFPRFLGGRRTIGACRDCNSAFGTGFEGRLHRAVEPTQVAFATNGYASPRPNLRWRNGYKEPGKDGSFDVFPNMTMRPSGVRAILLPGGGRHIIGNSKASVLKVARGLEKSNHGRYNPVPTTVRRALPLRSLNWSFPVNGDMRKLALKCFTALAAMNGAREAIEPDVRAYLFDAEESAVPEFSADYAAVPRSLTDFVPSHRIHIECQGAKAPVLGVFRPFDLVSVYCVLRNAHPGPAFAFSASLSLRDFKETFECGQLIGLRTPPARVLTWTTEFEKLCAVKRIDQYTSKAFGSVRLKLTPPLAHLQLQRSLFG